MKEQIQALQPSEKLYQLLDKEMTDQAIALAKEGAITMLEADAHWTQNVLMDISADGSGAGYRAEVLVNFGDSPMEHFGWNNDVITDYPLYDSRGGTFSIESKKGPKRYRETATFPTPIPPSGADLLIGAERKDSVVRKEEDVWTFYYRNFPGPITVHHLLVRFESDMKVIESIPEPTEKSESVGKTVYIWKTVVSKDDKVERTVRLKAP